MERELIFYPDERLKQVAEPITEEEFGSDWLTALVGDMVYAMRNGGDKPGVGLAAIQIGVNKSVVIYESKDGEVWALCNAEIISRSGKIKSYNEGCLSVRGFRADVRRSKLIKIVSRTIEGEHTTVKKSGYEAIILQHEIDHLLGKEFIDRVPDSDKDKRAYLNKM